MLVPRNHSSCEPECLCAVSGSLPVPGGYHNVLEVKHGPAASTEAYIVTTVFVREWRGVPHEGWQNPQSLYRRKVADLQGQGCANTATFLRALVQKRERLGPVSVRVLSLY